jgi:hypothetical protein
VFFPYRDISVVERIGEEAFMVYLKVLPSHLPGVTGGNSENPQSG